MFVKDLDIKTINFTPVAGIYLHIPLCKQACSYCDFHFSTNFSSRAEIVNAIIKEIERRKGYLQSEVIETIYFGGGTPSVLTNEELRSILEKIKYNFDTNNVSETTLECNPDDLSKEKLKQLRDLGIDRLSIGLQSFNDEELKWMNRAHTAKESLESVWRAQDAGFENITIDLIYGSKFQDMKSWESTLQKALSLNVQHISAYNLTIENKTKLGVDHSRGKEPHVSEELSSEQFRAMINVFQSNGFMHYEISNFAKEGFFSRHNSNYWKGVKYLGLGPSAHSYNGESRQWNISSNAAYVQKMNSNLEYFEIETLNEQQKYNEYILTRLRTMWGCSIKEIEELFGSEALMSFEKNVIKYHKYLNIQNDLVTLNFEGKLKADHLASEFFEINDQK